MLESCHHLGSFGRSRATAALVLVGALAVLACGRGDGARKITESRTANRAPYIPGAERTTAERFGYRIRSPEPSAPPRSSHIAWTLPEGWREIPPTEFRQGNFLAGAAGDVECYLTVLPDAAGGGAANVNRWRRQLGLPPLAANELAALPRVTVLGGEAVFVEGNGLLGVIREAKGRTIFLKMVGPKASLDAERESFAAMYGSLREVEEHAAEAADDRRAVPPGLSWDAPDGWVRRPDRTMRLVTFNPGGDESAECYVAVLAGRAGGEVANINRWRNQMGRPELSTEEIAALPTISVLGRQSRLVEVRGDFTGMSGPKRSGQALLGVVREGPAESLFVKLTGPETLVVKERANFIRFCESLR